MFIRSFLPFLFFETPAEAVGGGAVPGEAAPAPAPTTSEGGASPSDGGTPPPASPAAPQTLEQMEAAAQSRVLGTQPVEEVLPDEAPYRDAAALRQEIAQAREQWGPAAQALGGLDEVQREGLMVMAPAYALTRGNPALAEDLAYLQANYVEMDPGDREIMRSGMGQGSPAAVADFIQRAAEAWREAVAGEDEGGEEAPPGSEGLGYDEDDPDRPLTAADLVKWEQAQEAKREEQAELARQAQTIRAEAIELGYDPDANGDDPDGFFARASWNLLVEVAKQLPDGSLHKAHELLQQRDQLLIDRYVQGKMPDGMRPQPPTGGAPASGERRLGSLDEMNQAMRERVHAIPPPG